MFPSHNGELRLTHELPFESYVVAFSCFFLMTITHVPLPQSCVSFLQHEPHTDLHDSVLQSCALAFSIQGGISASVIG